MYLIGGGHTTVYLWRSGDRQILGVLSLLLPHDSWVWHSGCQAWQQTPSFILARQRPLFLPHPPPIVSFSQFYCLVDSKNK